MYSNPALALLLTFAFLLVLLGVAALGVGVLMVGAYKRRRVWVVLGGLVLAVPVEVLVALARPPPVVELRLDLEQGRPAGCTSTRGTCGWTSGCPTAR
jgi:hypothetical protein